MFPALQFPISVKGEQGIPSTQNHRIFWVERHV